MSKNWKLTTELPVEFSIKKSDNLFHLDNTDLLEYGDTKENSRRLIVIDMKVSNIYLKEIITYFVHHNIDYHLIVLDAIEREKSIDTLFYLLKQMEQFNVSRRGEPIIAIGGGVLLDIVGFAASQYRRGVPYIRVPTTLIGLVDASIGAKTAINFMERRNRLGSYFPPVVSYLDKTFLKTLEPIEISSGLGEILKMGVIKDKVLFDILKEHAYMLYTTKLDDSLIADTVIDRSIQGMKDELQQNLWERVLQRSVDFGHSFSPMLEMRSIVDDSVPSLTHGQAVALDVIFSSILSNQRNNISEDDVIDITNIAVNMGLPIFHPYYNNILFLLEALNDTIKHRDGNQYLPIPKKIGECMFINDVTKKEIEQAMGIMKERSNLYG